MSVTIQDVADKAGVSWRTAHRVINDNGLVTEATRDKVEDAIKELGYDPEAPPAVRGRKSFAVPLTHPVSLRVDERTAAELKRRGTVLSTNRAVSGQRGWDAELVRRALDWAFSPPEGVAPMPDDYAGAVDRLSP